MSPTEFLPTPYSYSAAVKAGDFVFLGLHRGAGDPFADQFESAIANLKATLAHYDLGLADLVKVNVWLKYIVHLPEMEKRFNAYFEQGRFPARMTATTQFIDEDCLLMIEGTAYAGE